MLTQGAAAGMRHGVTQANQRISQAIALFRQGDLDSARKAAEAELAAGTESAALRHLLGVACCRAGDLAAGILHLERAAALKPNDPAILVMLMRAQMDSGRPRDALGHAFNAEGLSQPELLLLWRTRAEAAHKAEDPRQEADALERVIKLDPNDMKARELIVPLLVSFDRPADAMVHLDAMPPSRARDRVRSSALILERQFEEGAAIGRSLLHTDPSDRDAWLSLVLLADRQGDLIELARLIQVGADAGYDEAELNYARAFVAKGEGHSEEALRLAEASELKNDKARRHALVASLADRMGESDKAFAAATAASLETPDRDQWLHRAAAHRTNLERIASAITPEWAASWADPPALKRQTPVFLVAFPRSGTTLLDTFLMGHPDVTVVEEQQMLECAAREFRDLTELDQAIADDIERAREAYFAELDRHVSAKAARRLVIDKLPLAMTGAVLVHRLFPDARFIFARRHPVDSVLSNYLQAFQLNDAMANFLDLGDAAAFYDVAMSLWYRARETLNLDVREIAYEELVADQEATLKPLVEWLGLSWDDSLLDHQRTAANRGVIVTPSYDQVTQPVHRRAAGRWRRYASHLKPILPMLDPWARRLGYGPIATD